VKRSHFATLFYGIFDLQSYTLRYSGAAHPPPFVLRKKDKTILELESLGTILGMFDNEVYEDVEININEGDKILLYTDGVFEVESKEKKHLNKDIFKEIFQEKTINASGFFLITDLYQALVRFSNSGEFEDDTAFLLVEMNSHQEAEN